MMKIILISPPFGELGQKSKGLPIAPPVLEYLAGLTKQSDPSIDIELIDANITDFSAETAMADLVGFTVLTPQAPYVYRMADILLKRGIQVILGGIHVQALPDEAAHHATAILKGEAEAVWPQILRDAAAHQLKPVYHGGHPELTGVPHPVTNLLPGSYIFGSFFTARGCPFDCSFCSVHSFFGRKTRFRPINEVVAEVAASKRRLFWGIDDNIWGTNIDRNIELYREMAKNISFKYWFGSGDLVTIDHSRSGELLKWARRSGMRAVLVGWESENPASLSEYKAQTKQGTARIDALRKIRDNGIEVMLFIMVGGRQESLDDYKRILDLCDKYNIAAHPTMLTPFPGTRLYEQYKDYLHHDGQWDYFDGNRALFDHPDPEMTKENREQALLWLRAELFTFPRMIKRLFKISPVGFPASYIMSWMLQFPQGRAFTEILRARSDIDTNQIKKLITGEVT
jgi:radical SAM superfamily enzyme YgiQ (UPF0313 family)